MPDETPPARRLKVLFLCTGNSCRSQMAEGWARHLKGDVIEPHSAGVLAAGLSSKAVRVMHEAGVDITAQQSQHIDELLDVELDYVVTVCDHAHETCPIFPANATIHHVPFDDPPSLTADMTDEQEMLDVYRRVRDEIRRFIETLPEALETTEPASHPRA